MVYFYKKQLPIVNAFESLTFYLNLTVFISYEFKF